MSSARAAHWRGDLLALGYNNLASTLLALGCAYDSAAGRAMAGAITALLGGIVATTSGELAAAHGVAEDFPEQREAVLRVMRNRAPRCLWRDVGL